MAGSTKLRFIQLGREVTGASGTEVDATILWMGLGAIEDTREVVWPEENVGYLSGTDRQYVPKVEAALHMDEAEATFEQFPILLDASIERVASTAEGSGNAGSKIAVGDSAGRIRASCGRAGRRRHLDR